MWGKKLSYHTQYSRFVKESTTRSPALVLDYPLHKLYSFESMMPVSLYPDSVQTSEPLP